MLAWILKLLSQLSHTLPIHWLYEEHGSFCPLWSLTDYYLLCVFCIVIALLCLIFAMACHTLGICSLVMEILGYLFLTLACIMLSLWVVDFGNMSTSRTWIRTLCIVYKAVSFPVSPSLSVWFFSVFLTHLSNFVLTTVAVLWKCLFY